LPLATIISLNFHFFLMPLILSELRFPLALFPQCVNVRIMPKGGKREGAGRPPSGKVPLGCRIRPETRAFLGDKPGEAIDRLVANLINNGRSKN
jgi:hypothetical protein